MKTLNLFLGGVAIAALSGVFSVWYYKNYIEECNLEMDAFMYADLETAKRVIQKQDSIINVINDHCWEEHDCELPWLDGDYTQEIDSMKEVLNYAY